MAAHRSGIQLTAEEQIEIFGTTAFSAEYAAEAEERWADGDALLADLAQAKRDGVKPGSDRANTLVRRHVAGIERFYDCNPTMQIAPAEMYLADERFTRYYDDVEPGLANFLHDIIVAGAARSPGAPT